MFKNLFKKFKGNTDEKNINSQSVDDSNQKNTPKSFSSVIGYAKNKINDILGNSKKQGVLETEVSDDVSDIQSVVSEQVSDIQQETSLKSTNRNRRKRGKKTILSDKNQLSKQKEIFSKKLEGHLFVNKFGEKIIILNTPNSQVIYKAFRIHPTPHFVQGVELEQITTLFSTSKGKNFKKIKANTKFHPLVQATLEEMSQNDETITEPLTLEKKYSPADLYMKKKQEERVQELRKEISGNSKIIQADFQQISSLHGLSQQNSQHDEKMKIMSIVSIFDVLKEKVSSKLNSKFDSLDAKTQIQVISHKYLHFIKNLNIGNNPALKKQQLLIFQIVTQVTQSMIEYKETAQRKIKENSLQKDRIKLERYYFVLAKSTANGDIAYSRNNKLQKIAIKNIFEVLSARAGITDIQNMVNSIDNLNKLKREILQSLQGDFSKIGTLNRNYLVNLFMNSYHIQLKYLQSQQKNNPIKEEDLGLIIDNNTGDFTSYIKESDNTRKAA